VTEPSQDEKVVPEAAEETSAAAPAGEQETPAPRPDGQPAPTEAPAEESGQAQPDQPEQPEQPEEVEDELTAAQRAVRELTEDLKRLQAEFVNYKRRVERDRELIRENATYAALAPIVEVLDTIDRAREHGDLDPGFKAVADQLERTVERLGLSKFGAPGDAFDPTIHEALSHIGEDPEVEVTTCKVIAKAGYRIGERVVRAAQVLVVDPAASNE
jgi:molecular chaperone GrpE